MAANEPGRDGGLDTVARKTGTGPVRPAPVKAAGLVRIEDVHTGAFPATLWPGSIRLLSYRGPLTWLPNNTRAQLVIGRAKTCDLIIDHDLVSRVHGYITIIDKGCVYIDQSRNGSFILMNGVLTKLNKNGLILDGVGTLILGSDPNENKVNRVLTIEFEICDGV